MQKVDYEERLDKIFSKNSMWKHRTFRTILDPFSSEWNATDYDEKMQILEKVVSAGEDLEVLIMDYKLRYHGLNRKDIVSNVESALLKLLHYNLSTSKF